MDQLIFTDTRKHLRRVRALYNSAFPPDERAPFGLMMRKARREGTSFYAVLDKETFVGLCYVMRKDDLVYLYYLAVEETCRDRGYGTRILQQLREMFADCAMTVSVEDTELKDADNPDERLRRLEFYERNGFQRLHFGSVEAGVQYESLGTRPDISQRAYLSIMADFCGPRLFPVVFKGTRILAPGNGYIMI